MRLVTASAVLLVLVGLPGLVRAQITPDGGDAKRGAIIAAQGTPGGAPPCAQCHAFNGESDGSGAFPRLAQQSADYLLEQLRDFASGLRDNALMSQIARLMSAADIADASAYYAGVSAPFVPMKAADPALVKRGAVLATTGVEEMQLPACNACHGPAGAGEPPTIPYLAGQYSQYIVANLQMWQKGFRKNSPGGMAAVAMKLDPADMVAVAAYYQQLTPSLETRPSTSGDR
jgi:cytochrome c553